MAVTVILAVVAVVLFVLGLAVSGMLDAWDRRRR